MLIQDMNDLDTPAPPQDDNNVAASSTANSSQDEASDTPLCKFYDKEVNFYKGLPFHLSWKPKREGKRRVEQEDHEYHDRLDTCFIPDLGTVSFKSDLDAASIISYDNTTSFASDLDNTPFKSDLEAGKEEMKKTLDAAKHEAIEALKTEMQAQFKQDIEAAKAELKKTLDAEKHEALESLNNEMQADFKQDIDLVKQQLKRTMDQVKQEALTSLATEMQEGFHEDIGSAKEQLREPLIHIGNSALGNLSRQVQQDFNTGIQAAKKKFVKTADAMKSDALPTTREMESQLQDKLHETEEDLKALKSQYLALQIKQHEERNRTHIIIADLGHAHAVTMDRTLAAEKEMVKMQKTSQARPPVLLPGEKRQLAVMHQVTVALKKDHARLHRVIADMHKEHADEIHDQRYFSLLTGAAVYLDEAAQLRLMLDKVKSRRSKDGGDIWMQDFLRGRLAHVEQKLGEVREERAQHVAQRPDRQQQRAEAREQREQRHSAASRDDGLH